MGAGDLDRVPQGFSDSDGGSEPMACGWREKVSLVYLYTTDMVVNINYLYNNNGLVIISVFC